MIVTEEVCSLCVHA